MGTLSRFTLAVVLACSSAFAEPAEATYDRVWVGVASSRQLKRALADGGTEHVTLPDLPAGRSEAQHADYRLVGARLVSSPTATTCGPCLLERALGLRTGVENFVVAVTPEVPAQAFRGAVVVGRDEEQLKTELFALSDGGLAVRASGGETWSQIPSAFSLVLSPDERPIAIEVPADNVPHAPQRCWQVAAAVQLLLALTLLLGRVTLWPVCTLGAPRTGLGRKDVALEKTLGDYESQLERLSGAAGQAHQDLALRSETLFARTQSAFKTLSEREVREKDMTQRESLAGDKRKLEDLLKELNAVRHVPLTNATRQRAETIILAIQGAVVPFVALISSPSASATRFVVLSVGFVGCEVLALGWRSRG